MVKTKDNIVKLDDTDVNILKIINEDVEHHIDRFPVV